MSSRSLIFESVEPRLLMAVDMVAHLTPGPNPIDFSSRMTSTLIRGDGEIYFVAADSLYRYDESQQSAERLTFLDHLADGRGRARAGEVHEMVYALGRPWFFVEEYANDRSPAIFSLITLGDAGDPLEVWIGNTLDLGNNIRVPFTLVEESGDELFFQVRTGARPSLTQLWSTQGTVATTNLVTDFAGSSDIELDLVVNDGQAFYGASYTVREFFGDGEWVSQYFSTVLVSDPNQARPVVLHESTRHDQFVEFDGDVFVSSADGLVRTDGTLEGTSLLTDFPVRHLREGGGLLYFTGYDEDGAHLGRTDGTLEGTLALAPLEAQTFSVDGSVFAFQSDTLYGTDGTPDGTVELVTGLDGFDRGSMTRAGENIFFAASDRVHGNELWVTDGTAAGTRLVRDINELSEGGFDSTPLLKAVLGDRLIFTADDGVSGRGLWITDGTDEGTQLLSPVQTDIPATGFFDLEPFGDFLAHGDEVLFTATSDAIGTEFWRTDGTPEGTGFIFDLHPGMEGVRPSSSQLMEVAGGVLFTAFDGTRDRLGLYTPDEVDALMADINDDGEVGFADFLLVSANFGREDDNNLADLNDDSVVDFQDYLALAGQYGQTR